MQRPSYVTGVILPVSCSAANGSQNDGNGLCGKHLQ
jgi:hypothetical protein